jgi:hypothetical protein
VDCCLEHERQTSAIFPALPETDIAITMAVMRCEGSGDGTHSSSMCGPGRLQA